MGVAITRISSVCEAERITDITLAVGRVSKGDAEVLTRGSELAQFAF